MLHDILTAHTKLAQQHPGLILLFADDAETDGTCLALHADAFTLHRVTGLPVDSVTSSVQPGPIPCVTIPGPRIEATLHSLIVAGHKVAICKSTTPPTAPQAEEEAEEEEEEETPERCRHCGLDCEDASGVCARCFARYH